MRGGVSVHVVEGAPRRRDAAAALLLAPLLGILGPLVLWPALILHVGLPVMAAGHLATGAGRARFAAEDRPRIVDGVEWLLGLYGWASLTAPHPPWRHGRRAVRLEVAPPSPPPTAAAALARVVTGLPSAAAALIAGALGLLPWLALAASVLVTGRAPAALRGVGNRVLRAEAAAVCRQAGVGPASGGPTWTRRSTGTGRTSASRSGQWRSASSERAR